jgi:predicted transcriptional regulator
VENLDWIVIVMKKWLSDPHLNCKKKMDLKKYMKVKTFLVNDNYDLIEKMEYFKKLH